MKLINAPDKAQEFGIINEQTRLVTTKALHEKRKIGKVPVWIPIVLIACVAAAVIVFFLAASNIRIYNKVERVAADDFLEDTSLDEAKRLTYTSNKYEVDTDVVWEYECSEEFKESHALSEISQFRYVSFQWYTESGTHRYKGYCMAKINGAWIIAGVHEE